MSNCHLLGYFRSRSPVIGEVSLVAVVKSSPPPTLTGLRKQHQHLKNVTQGWLGQRRYLHEKLGNVPPGVQPGKEPQLTAIEGLRLASLKLAMFHFCLQIMNVGMLNLDLSRNISLFDAQRIGCAEPASVRNRLMRSGGFEAQPPV